MIFIGKIPYSNFKASFQITCFILIAISMYTYWKSSSIQWMKSVMPGSHPANIIVSEIAAILIAALAVFYCSIPLMRLIG
ncbi:MAG: hypothetical protein K2P81_05020 [Bacteriovoracaceae bacterium]|nr:hypothetical protein [Bacteriovoracaceae bacterium]